MAAKFSLFLALNLLLFAAAVHGCAPYCEPADPAPPAQPAPSSYGPEPPAPPPPTDSIGRCPIDALKLRVCANVLGVVQVGLPRYEECCPVLKGLVDLDAAVCLCTAIRANVLGIHLNIPVSLNLILNHCGKNCPADFTCPQ